MKLEKKCFLIVVCSLCCLLSTGISARMSNFSAFDHVIVVIWGKAFAFLNPSLNSAIFFWKNRTLRGQAKNYTYTETSINETSSRVFNKNNKLCPFDHLNLGIRI